MLFGRRKQPHPAPPKAPPAARPAVKPAQVRLDNGQTLPVELRRRRGMKRLILRVDVRKPLVIASGPLRTPDKALHALIEANKPWIEKQLARAPQASQPVKDGDLIQLRGVATIVRRRPGRGAAQLQDGQPAILTISASETTLAAALKRTLKTWAHAQALEHLATMQTRSGLTPQALVMRDTRSRWGSCTSDGRIMLSWRLIGANPAVFEYVVAHELAHLKEMNHGPAFWTLVETMVPDWRVHRRWLREHGPSLHANGF